MSLAAVIVDALLAQPAMLSLPRWRVLADVRERFACGDCTARTAYAQARVRGHARTKRETGPQARVERVAA